MALLAAHSNQCKSCDKWRSGQQKESVTVTGHCWTRVSVIRVCACIHVWVWHLLLLVTEGVCWHLTRVLTTWPWPDPSVWLGLRNRGSRWLRPLTDGPPLLFWLKASTQACPQRDHAGWASRGSSTWPSCTGTIHVGVGETATLIHVCMNRSSMTVNCSFMRRER